MRPGAGGGNRAHRGPVQPRRSDLGRECARRDRSPARRVGEAAEGHSRPARRLARFLAASRRADRRRDLGHAAGQERRQGAAARRPRREARHHEPPERRSSLLRPADRAVDLPEDGNRREVRRGAEVHLLVQVDRPDSDRPATVRPGEPTIRRREHHDGQGRHDAVHRARGDGLPGPRPLPDRDALHAGQALEPLVAAGSVEPQAADHARRQLPHLLRTEGSAVGQRRAHRHTRPG